MKDKSIKVSEKHGLNPSICLCPVCRKENGIALLGNLKETLKLLSILLAKIYVMNVRNKYMMAKCSLLK